MLTVWVFERFEKLGELLFWALVNPTNVFHLLELVQRARCLCPLWFTTSVHMPRSNEEFSYRVYRNLYIVFGP